MANIKTIDDVPGIILYTPLEKPDEQEKNWKELYFKLLNEIGDKSDNDAHSFLTSITLNDANALAQVSIALLYGMMIDQHQSSRYFQFLNTITRDRYSLCVSHLKKLIGEKFHRLQPFAQDQIIWIVSEFINHSANECHILVQQLLRHIITGNTTPRNISLIQQLLNLCIQYKDWLYEQSTLIPIVWYTFMSLIYDHYPSQFDSLRDKEISLCTQLIRERFDFVKIIGRDLIRVLFNVSKIPQFESVWNDIILAPSNANSSISNLRALLHTPTPRHILASRLTPEMETWLLFMMKEVKTANVKRYQQWFASKYFPTPFSQTLAPDIIRYICGVWHPPNHILSSDITPRYFQIGWILKTVNAQMWQIFSTQALLYDWYFFVKGKDGIMNIEPAILLMVNSLKRHPEITAQCIEQICIGMNPLIAVDPNIKDDVMNGIQTSVKILLDNKVVHSIEPICNLPGLNQHLRDQLKTILEPFLNKDHGVNKNVNPHHGQTIQKEIPVEQGPAKLHKSLIDELFPEVSKQVQNKIKEEQPPPKIKEDIPPKIEQPTKSTEESEEDVFSGWSDKVANIVNEISQSPGSTKIVKDVILSPLESVNIPENVSISNYKEVFSTISKMMDEGNISSSQTLFESFLKCLSSETDFEAYEMHTSDIGRLIIETFIDEFKETNPKSFFDSNELIYSRIFDAYNKGKSPLIKKILCDMRDIEPSIGYRFLCYAAGRENIGSDDNLISSIIGDQMDLADEDGDEEDERLIMNLQNFIDLHNRQIEKDKNKKSVFKDYLDFIKNIDIKKNSWKKIFLEDCQLCAQANITLFMDLIPYLFRYFSDYTVGNTEFIKLVTTFTYPEKLLSIECQVSASDYAIIGDSLDQILPESLDWESFSQIALWRLISAEFVSEYDILLASIIPFLKRLDHIKHSEAILGITSILLSKPPKTYIIESLLALPIRLSRFVCTILTRWSRTELTNVPKREESLSLRKYIIWSEQLTHSLTEALQSISKNSKYSGARRKMLIRKAMTHLTLLKSIIREEAVDLFVSHDKLASTIIELITQNQLENEFEDLLNTLTESSDG